jgi:hypothetical protein
VPRQIEPNIVNDNAAIWQRHSFIEHKVGFVRKVDDQPNATILRYPHHAATLGVADYCLPLFGERKPDKEVAVDPGVRTNSSVAPENFYR